MAAPGVSATPSRAAEKRPGSVLNTKPLRSRSHKDTSSATHNLEPHGTGQLFQKYARSIESRSHSDTNSRLQARPQAHIASIYTHTNRPHRQSDHAILEHIKGAISSGDGADGPVEDRDSAPSNPREILDPWNPNVGDTSAAATTRQLSIDPFDPSATLHFSCSESLGSRLTEEAQYLYPGEGVQKDPLKPRGTGAYRSSPAVVAAEESLNRPRHSSDGLEELSLDNVVRVASSPPGHKNKDLRVSYGPGETADVVEGGDGVGNFSKQITRCRRNIDIVLLKRTQWRQENQKLEDCRRHLRQSTANLKSAIMNERDRDVPLATQTLMKKRKKEIGRRSSAIMETGPNEIQLDKFAINVGSDTDIIDDMKESSESEHTATSQPNVAELHELYLEDFVSQTRQEDIVKGLMEDLSNREFHLDTLLASIKDKMHSQKVSFELRSEMLEGDLPLSDTSPRASSGNEIPDPVAEYFEAAGDIGVCKERLQELEYTHQEGRTERDFLRDQGCGLDVTDEEFGSNYRAQRKQIENDLLCAQELVAIALERCKQAGLDPELYRHAGQPSDPASPSQSDEAAGANLLPPKRRSGAESQQPLNPSSPGLSKLQIEGWLHDVPDVDVLPLPEIHPLSLSRRVSEESSNDRPMDISLASFEYRSFDVEAFGPSQHPRRDGAR